MDEEDLQRRATLAIERQGACDRLAHRVVQVDLGQDDARVLRIQTQGGAQPVRARVQLLQGTGALVGADKGEDIDLAAGHQRADRLATATVDHVDHPRRETVAKGLEQRADQQHAELGRLEHHGIAHDQRRDQGGEGLVQRVVVGPHAQGHAQRHAADLAEGVLLQLEATGAAIQLLERTYGVDDVVAGAVELLLRILEVLADFPHQQLDHLLALLAHARQEGFDMGDALRHAHGRPGALAVVIGAHRRLQSHQRRLRVQLRGAAEYHLLIALLGRQEHRAAHRRHGTFPDSQLAIDQIVALLDRLTEAIGFGNLGQGGKQRAETTCSGHGITSSDSQWPAPPAAWRPSPGANNIDGGGACHRLRS